MAGLDIYLYAASIMNRWKSAIFLEKAKVEHELTYIDFDKRIRNSNDI